MEQRENTQNQGQLCVCPKNTPYNINNKKYSYEQVDY